MKDSVSSDDISMFRILPFICGLLCVCLTPLCGPLGVASADVAQTGPGVYQEIGLLKDKIISTSRGIFVLSSATAIPLQKFDPNNIKSEGVRTAFVAYDSKSNTYSEVVLGGARYTVQGSFALEVGTVRIKVDNYATPYLTAVFNAESKSPSIVPFNATTAFGVYTGAAAVSILEANQAFAHIQDIAPYIVTETGNLTLKNEQLPAGTIGLAIPQADNPCLLENAIFVEYATIQRIKALPDGERKKQLEVAIEKAKPNKPLSDAILLRVEEKKKLIAFDPKDSQIVVIRPVSSSAERQICEVEKVKL